MIPGTTREPRAVRKQRRSANLPLPMKYLFLIAVLFSGSIHAEVAPEPMQRVALADYNEQQKVVMYATSWCPYCQQARNYFRERGIPYVEHDIERDADARREFKAFGGRSIPVIFVGKRRMDGFSVDRFRKIYR